MRLDFAGDLSWWQGLILAALAAWLAWRYYRRDTRPVSRRWAHALLPSLRSLAIFGILLCLTGPILTHRLTEGRLGRVLVFVDGSQSMSVTDEHLDAGRKLLIAAARGQTSTESADMKLLDITRGLAHARRLAGGTDSGPAPLTREQRARAVADELDRVSKLLEGLDPARLPAADPPRGGISLEYFDGLNGSTLDNLPADRLTKPPSQSEARDQFESRQNRGDNYATRFRGYIHPPVSGPYTFYISSDDASVLMISPDADPSKKKAVARVEGFSLYRNWQSQPSQKSAPVELQAGRMVYVETLHKEGSGEDHISVGWDRPDGKQERPIPGTHLSPFQAAAQGGAPALAQIRQSFGEELLAPAKKLADQKDRRDSAAADAAFKTLTAALAKWEGRFSTAFAAYASTLIQSGDAKVRRALDAFDTESRWKRAESAVLDPDRGFATQLLGTHELDVALLAGRQVKQFWTSDGPGNPPDALAGAPDAPVSNLSDGIRETLGEQHDRTAVVLLTDGRHNDGASPLALAQFLGAQGVPLHIVGLGNHLDPPDLSVVEVSAPQSIHAEDRLKGQVTLRDLMPPGANFTLTISHDGKELWKQDVTTQGNGLRKIDFDFAVKEAATQAGAARRDMQVMAVPLAMQVAASAVRGEAKPDNNTTILRSLVVTQGRKVLVLDGRPRWETRYVRDLFIRDQQWQTELLLAETAGGSTKWSQVDGPGKFPPDRETLFSYGLIVLGELPPGTLTTEQLEWLNDFVEKRGGGLALIDGRRRYLREYGQTPIGPLLPVGEAEGTTGGAPERLELTPAGRESAVLRLERDAELNAGLWRSLPVPHWVAPVKALEGTQVLASAVFGDGDPVPVLVHRQVGAGSVLYCGFDSTWRWRYEVADLYHTRYWNQLAAFLMEPPFAVKDQYVALDVGGPTYATGDSARIRARLSDRQGKPLVDAQAEAVVYRDGRKVATVPLEADPNRGGMYRAATAGLEPGEYEISVSVAGFSELETRARAGFTVEPRRAQEFADLTCDEDLLRAMAAASGGTYLREEEADRLTALLRPLSEGRVVITETRLAQSYWWFAPIMLLLTLEWIIRKRVGMM